jgi:hypothetical protein
MDMNFSPGKVLTRVCMAGFAVIAGVSLSGCPVCPLYGPPVYDQDMLKGFGVYGMVTTSLGTPVPDILVRVQQADSVLVETRTDQRGLFSAKLAEDVPGTLTVTAIDTDGPQHGEFAESSQEITTNPTDTAAERYAVNFTLTPKASGGE